MRRFALVGFCLGLLAIIWVTLGPERPSWGEAGLERFTPYLVLGALLSAALPRRPLLVGVVCMALACGLEALQAIAPHRDPRLIDAVEKLAGAWCGAAVVWIWSAVIRVVTRRLTPPDLPSGDKPSKTRGQRDATY